MADMEKNYKGLIIINLYGWLDALLVVYNLVNSYSVWKISRKIDFTKGQLISKANCEAMNASKKRTNEFVFSCVFVRFLEEIEDTKKVFRN